MANPFALSPYTFSTSGDRKGSDELGPDEVAPSNTKYTTLESPFSKDRGSSFPWRTTEHDQSTHSGPEELSTNEIVKPSPTHKAYTPADKKSTDASLQDIPSSSPFSKPSYDRPSSANRKSAHIGPYDISTVSSFSRLSYSSPSKANRISRHLAPDEKPTTQDTPISTRDRDPASVTLNQSVSTQSAFPIRKSMGPGDWEESPNVSPGAADVTTIDDVKQPLANTTLLAAQSKAQIHSLHPRILLQRDLAF
jgi:hypothetical protein